MSKPETRMWARLWAAALLALALAGCRPVGRFADSPFRGDGGPGSWTTDGGFEVSSDTELMADGRLAMHTRLPALAGDCGPLAASGAPCADVDRDGLVDAWEELVLDRFRPVLRFDETEPVVRDPSAVLGDVGRVTLARTRPLLVHAFVMLGYSLDYGSCGQTAHHGDSERVAMELSAIEGAGPGDVSMVRAYTAAHEGASTDHSRVYAGGSLDQLRFVRELPSEEPRWVVFPSAAKHGSYANPELCERALRAPCFAELCNPDVADPAPFDALPPVVNAGEETAPFLRDLGPAGFPGDDAWADQPFCGGLERVGCSSPAREKLLVNPFTP